MSSLIPDKLENSEIKKTLQSHIYPDGYKPTERVILDIINQFWFHDFYNSFISDPIYLDKLISFLSQNKVTKFNRFDFYKFFISSLLDEGFDDKEEALRTLRTIATSFEIAQSPSMHPNDFEGILNSIQKQKRIFDPEWFINKHLGKYELDAKYHKVFIFEHHSITEFIVADALSELEDIESRIKSFMILDQEGVVALKPSWHGVLRFLLESKVSDKVLLWLVTFLEKYPENVDESISDIISTIKFTPSDEIKERVFSIIYNVYFERLLWIPKWTSEGLSRLISKANYKKLKKDINETKATTETYVHQGNVVTILEDLLDMNSPLISQDKQFWKDILLNLAKSDNNVLRRHCLAALAKYHDSTIISKVSQNLNSNDSLVRDAFIQFCIESSPEAKEIINALIDSIKNGSTIYARHGLYNIKSKAGVNYFLEKISKDELFLKQFLRYEHIFDDEDTGDWQLISHIRSSKNEETIILLKSLIKTVLECRTIYQEDRSIFLREIVRIIKSQDNDYLFELMDQIIQSENPEHLLYEYSFVVSALIDKENVTKFIEKAESLSERLKQDCQRIVENLAFTKSIEAKDAIEKAVEIGKIRPRSKVLNQNEFVKAENTRKFKVFQEFDKQLQPAPGQYIPSVFQYYIENRSIIEEYWKPQHKKRLIKLAIDEVALDFEQFRDLTKDAKKR